MHHDKITLLGTGTCQLQKHRIAPGILVELSGMRLLFDCGPGIIRRLHDLGIRQNDLQHIFISHFHPDHVADLIPWLHAACWSRTDPRSAPLHLYGPGGLKKFMEQLYALFGSRAITSDAFTVHCHEPDAEEFTIDEFPFEFVHLPPHENHGLRFSLRGKRYAFTGDSLYHEEEIRFLKGAELAVIDGGHISDDEIVLLAVESGVKKLVCSHLYRELDQTLLSERASARGFTGEIVTGEDLMSFEML